ncbi:MAG: transketolase [Deltaproteobacteria bacterium]|nr:transketolase [Deltaproteobacteria bacterium]
MASPFTGTDLDLLSINTLRALCIDVIQRANSGHPGLPLGASPMAYVLWSRHLKHDPARPDWPDRDRFVLSAGHGSSMLYSLLHLTGYPLSMEDLHQFRQWSSLTPGHPEYHLTAGVEATTGPLGQGFANAVGMALAERFLAHLFNRTGYPVVDHYTYSILGDGCVMEGVTFEAAALAGHLRLGKLICLYDSNDVTLDGPAALALSENVGARFDAAGWQVLHVEDGDHDVAALDRAIEAAKADTEHPSLIVVKTTIGYGSPGKQGTSACHGSPFGAAGVAEIKRTLGLDPDKHFHVPDEVLANLRTAVARGTERSRAWDRRFAQWADRHPDLARTWGQVHNGELPDGWDRGLPQFKAGDSIATRAAGGKILNALATAVPWLIGGDADLSCSTATALRGMGDFDGRTGEGRNIHFGVREHAMAAIANGIAYHGGVKTFASTFFVFSDYMRPALRLAAMNRLPVIWVWTHDSVAVGEDGPTHQPIEHLAALRCTPGLVLLRPADAAETVEAWKVAIESRDTPVGLVLSRQPLPVLDRDKVGGAAGLRRGAYVLQDPVDQPLQAILIATGSEVHVALAAAGLLADGGIGARVVSMPSWELFERQPREYRDSVLPPSVQARVSVEAGVTFGWQRYVGNHGIALGIDRYGASAPCETVMEKLGMTRAAVAEAVRQVLRNLEP